MFDLLFTKLSSLYSIPQNLSLSFNFLVNSLVSNPFPFVVGQNFGPFVNIDIWNLVRCRFDKLMILGCIFFRDVLLVVDPSFFVFC